MLVLAAVPIIFLAGLLRARLARSGLGALLVELREPAEPGALRDSLARALRDPSLELAYWVPEYRSYVGVDGEPIDLPAEGSGRVATFVERGGTSVAALIHDASLQDEPELVGAVTSAAGIALENERLQADLRARLADLRASRARIVEAGDTARRKLERDLHDGAQQRLVSMSVVLRLVENRVPADSNEATLLKTARTELNESLEELRRIARGIHPAVLSDHGLPVALETLAARAPVRVTLDVDLVRAPARAGRGRGLLPGRRRADERRQVRRGGIGDRRRRARERHARRRGDRRRQGRRRPRAAAPGCADWPTASRRSTGG